MPTFADVMENEASKTLTENGALAYNTTGTALIDLFATVGALRTREPQEIIDKFAAAYDEDPVLATKMLFYCGDIRNGGTGERRTFRIALKWFAQYHPNIVRRNMENIAYYNRFDSLFELCDTPVEAEMWRFVEDTLCADLSAYKASGKVHFGCSLLAKWMPSEKASSEATRKLAHRAMRALALTPRKYRIMLSALRKHINVVERLMSNGEWDKIDYSKVPSYAMRNYRDAFAKHDYDRFRKYIGAVKSGEAKIHSGTLYPYDLVGQYLCDPWDGLDCGDACIKQEVDDVIEEQWKALPNYLTKPMNAIVMADVSGSMDGRPMETSIGLAIYFAQHNTGPYHGKYMTFSDYPNYVDISKNKSLWGCVKQVAETEVGYSTDLEAAFLRILADAKNHHVSNEDMPKALVVVSDMEINPYMHSDNIVDFVDAMKRKYEAANYSLPKLVLWNVDARKDTFLSKSEDVVCISGQSPAAFKHLCENLEGKTAWEFMCDVLMGAAYERVVI